MQQLPAKLYKFLCALIIISVIISAAGCKIPIETGNYDNSSLAKSSENSKTENFSQDGVSETEKSSLEESSNEDDFSDTDSSGQGSDINAEFTVKKDEYVYHIPGRYYSEGIKNIVRRARQIYDMRWVPLEDMTGFNGDYAFKKGVEIRGIPYGQPVYSGKFIGFDATVEEFYNQSKKADSLFYTGKSEYEEISAYYSLDCTAFVCYAWNTNVRMYTAVLVQFGDYMGKKLNTIQVGDALIKTGLKAHAVLVTGVIEDDKGNIVWLEIMEQTPPLTKLTRYGRGELYTLEEFTQWYLEDGFYIYRNTDYRNGTPYTPYSVVPLDNENGKGDSPYRSVNTEVDGDNVAVNGVFACDENIKEFYYSVTPLYYGIEKYKTREDAMLRFRSEPVDGETLDFIYPGTVLTITDYFIDGNGEKWGKLRYNGNCGWLWLDGSELLGGALRDYERVVISDSDTRTQTVEGYRYAGLACEFKIPRNAFDSECQIMLYARTSSGKVYSVGNIMVKPKR